jgi:glycosyltransferase involved in cell wall biosynthesis
MITYNHAPFIAQAVENVLRQQTSFPFELVIGEDCSTDGTREIVLDYQRKHPEIIKVVTSEKNVGAKGNAYRVLRACVGEYLAFCEGDDYWHSPFKLQKQVDHLEANRDCGLVYTGYDVYHVASGRRIREFVKFRKWDMLESPSLCDIVESKGGRSRGIMTCTVMLRRQLCMELFESDPHLHQSDHFKMGDTQLWAEMATKAKLHFIPESLVTHNITEESATRSKDPAKVLHFALSGCELQLYLCDKYDLPEHVRRKYREYRADCLLRLAFHTRDAALAEEVRKSKPALTLKEWMRYGGAKNIAVHHLYRSLAAIPTMFRQRHPQWR